MVSSVKLYTFAGLIQTLCVIVGCMDFGRTKYDATEGLVCVQPLTY